MPLPVVSAKGLRRWAGLGCGCEGFPPSHARVAQLLGARSPPAGESLAAGVAQNEPVVECTGLLGMPVAQLLGAGSHPAGQSSADGVARREPEGAPPAEGPRPVDGGAPAAEGPRLVQEAAVGTRPVQEAAVGTPPVQEAARSWVVEPQSSVCFEPGYHDFY